MKNIYKILPLILTLAILLLAIRTYGQEVQTIKIQSIVRDIDGNPLANATVTTGKGTIQVVTGEDGKFLIEVPQNEIVQVSHENFETTSIPAYLALSGVILQPTRLKGMVNLPFTRKSERKTIGAITVLNPDDIASENSAQSLEEILADRVPGLRGSYNIRGIGNALTVVDGTPRPLSVLNLEEVEQITILKDVHAALLYGPEAQNGVILVQTKRGRPYQKKVNVFAERGISTVRQMPNYLNSADYMRLRNEALLNDGALPAYTDSVINLYAGAGNPYRYPSVDYYSDEYLKNSTNYNRVVTEFSGGNDNTQYYANVGWTNNGKLYALGKGEDASTNRFNIRASSDFKINNFISGNLDGIFIFNIDNEPVGNFWKDAATLHPYFYSPLIPIDMVNDEAIQSTGKLINNRFILGGTNQYQNTVYGNMYFGGKSQNIYRYMQFNNGLKFDLGGVTKGLSFNTNLGFDFFNDYNQYVDNEYAVYNPQWVTTANLQDSISSTTKIGRDLASGTQNVGDSFFYRRYGISTTLDYNRVFNEKHALNATLLGYFNRVDNEGDVISDKHAHVGLRLAYAYNDRYLIDFSSTLANSIRLPKSKRAGFSPALALGWIISEEDFLAGAQFVNFLKLKASAGILKTDQGMGFYLYNSTFSRLSSISWFDNNRFNSPVILTRAENQDLSFREISNVNFGLESFFFNNSLGLDINLFHTVDRGELTQRSIYPAYLGSNVPFENYGAVSYTGAEIGMNLKQTITEDFSVKLGVNMLVQKSKVVERDEQWEYDYQYRQGRPNDLIFGLEALGFFADSADIASHPAQAFGEVKPGDIKYKDQNNDGVIDQNDAVEIGNWNPRLSYGLSFGLEYKNLSLFAIGGGQFGSETIFSGDYFWIDGNDKYTDVVLNRWTPETASSATYPRMSSGGNPNNFRTSTFWMSTNNQFNLNHAQLTYNIGSSFLQRFKMKNTSIYLRGQNLLMIAKDAEKRLIRINQAPLMRNFALGLRMNF